MTLLENVFLAIYVMELAMKMYVWRLKFFFNTWNLFGIVLIISINYDNNNRLILLSLYCLDFIIVLSSVVDFMVPLIVQNTANFNAQVFKVLRVFRAVRAIRALRVLRTIRYL